MQLVAYGAQDVYLTGDPQITFWKGVYRRHTHFAIESIENTFSGTAAAGGSAECVISRNADLLGAVHLQVAASVAGTSTNFGHELVKKVEVHVGGQMIDRQYGLWMDIWDDLTTPAEKSAGYNTMVAKGATATDGDNLYIPLQFWFCRHPGSAIPLVALQFHEVKLKFEFGSPSGATIDSIKLFADYVYLDEEERQRFSQSAQEYLIEQVQHHPASGLSNGVNTVTLPFNHPVKELVWTVGTSTVPGTFGTLNDTASGGTKITFNNQDRASARPGSYYNLVQPYQHHTRVPTTNVYVYSFGLRPEEHQPSGTVNFSRIDNASITLDTTGGATSADIFAVNYNVLRVQSGLGGLAYSN